MTSLPFPPSESLLATQRQLHCQTRNETNKTLQTLCHGHRTPSMNVWSAGPCLVSDIPLPVTNTPETGVLLGIDEAGRGPALGPMTYAAVYWHPNSQSNIPDHLTDSKQLTAKTRASLFQQIQDCPELGFVLRVLHASEISRNMYRKATYNLNAMSHNAAIEMIQAVLDRGVKIDTCYIDTVGPPDSYRRKLEVNFEGYGVQFVVEKKADDKYECCSAASVVAKVSRDLILESWNWTEPNLHENDDTESRTMKKNFGSGYPSDPKVKEWLVNNFVDPIFCYPDLVRFSWAPAKEAMKIKGLKMEWKADNEEEEEEDGTNQMNISSFMLVKTSKKHRGDMQSKNLPKEEIYQRLAYFKKRRMFAVTQLVNLDQISDC